MRITLGPKAEQQLSQLFEVSAMDPHSMTHYLNLLINEKYINQIPQIEDSYERSQKESLQPL